MPVFIEDHATIEIAPIGGCDLKMLSAEDLDYANKFTSPSRRSAWLTWRAIARKYVGQTAITYDSVGCPTTQDGKLHIGVSHNPQYAAVIISPYRCAIDIESVDRNFKRVEERYVSPEEKELVGSDHELFLAAMWCAKETIYKISGRKGVDFIRDIRISHIDLSGGHMRGTLHGPDGSHRTIELHAFTHEGCMVVWATVPTLS